MALFVKVDLDNNDQFISSTTRTSMWQSIHLYISLLGSQPGGRSLVAAVTAGQYMYTRCYSIPQRPRPYTIFSLRYISHAPHRTVSARSRVDPRMMTVLLEVGDVRSGVGEVAPALLDQIEGARPHSGAQPDFRSGCEASRARLSSVASATSHHVRCTTTIA